MIYNGLRHRLLIRKMQIYNEYKNMPIWLLIKSLLYLLCRYELKGFENIYRLKIIAAFMYDYKQEPIMKKIVQNLDLSKNNKLEYKKHENILE